MKRIKIENCSVRIRYLAEPLGFKTLASFHKFIKQCHPFAKIYFNASYMRAHEVLKAIEREYRYEKALSSCEELAAEFADLDSCNWQGDGRLKA